MGGNSIQITRTMCWQHDTIHLATVTLQESREFGGFVKVGTKSSLGLFLHRALHLLLFSVIRGSNYSARITGWNIWFNGKTRKSGVYTGADETVPSQERLHQDTDNKQENQPKVLWEQPRTSMSILIT